MENSYRVDGRGASLKQRTISASAWTVSEFFIRQSLRFGSNLILTRFLPSEAFGLMQLVFVFTFGLTLLSDLGIRTNIIQHQRGDDPDFLRTAWSFQALRGLFLWIVGLFLTLPFASFYGYEELAMLIPVSCLVCLITGFTSVNIYVYEKHLQVRVVSLIKIASALIATLTMVVSAWIFQSIWALVTYGLVDASVILLLSHLIPGIALRFSLHREYFSEIVKFGKWLIPSSLLTFILLQLDKLYLGKVLPSEELGFYGIASSVTVAVNALVTAYNSSVTLPLYRKLLDESRAVRKMKIVKLRVSILCPLYAFLFILILFGEEIFTRLYPSGFAEVGRIIPILSFATALGMLSLSIGPILLAAGNSFRPNIVLIARIALLLLSMHLGFTAYGFTGALYGIALAQIAVYPVVILSVVEFGIWTPHIDALFLAFTLLAARGGGVI